MQFIPKNNWVAWLISKHISWWTKDMKIQNAIGVVKAKTQTKSTKSGDYAIKYQKNLYSQGSGSNSSIIS